MAPAFLFAEICLLCSCWQEVCQACRLHILLNKSKTPFSAYKKSPQELRRRAMGAFKYLSELWRRKQSDTLCFLMRVRCWE